MKEVSKKTESAVSADNVTENLTNKDVVKLMARITADVLNGRITPSEANASVSAYRVVLRVVEMTLKFGKTAGASNERMLSLM